MSTSTHLDTMEFRRALGAFTTGVTVVTTRDAASNDIGLTANSFNSVSLDPPMVLWSLAKTSLSLEAFRASNYFAVHILSEGQEDISNRFAKRGNEKFLGLHVDRGVNDLPLLQECSARFICKTAYQYEGGDHIIFVGEVIDFIHRPTPPLLFHSGAYGKIQKPDTDTTEIEVLDDSFGYLLRSCYRQLIEPLKAELTKRDLVIGQHYLLGQLARGGSKPLAEIIQTLAVTSPIPSTLEIQDLVDRGYIHEAEGCMHLTREGFTLRIELASFYKAIESDAMQSFDSSRSQSLKVLLGQLIHTLEARPKS